MDDIKITAIVVPEPIFPSTSGKAEIDGLTALSVKWAMEHNERVAAVPEADKRKHINPGDLCTIIEIEQLLQLKDSKSVILYKAAGSGRYRIEAGGAYFMDRGSGRDGRVSDPAGVPS